MTGTLPLPRPRTARQVHVGEHVHLGPPRAADRHQPELDRRRRAGALIDGFTALGVRQTVIGPASSDVPAGPAGTPRVVQRRGAALPLVAQVSVNGGLVRHAVGGVVHVHLHEPVVLPPAALLALARVGPVVVHLGASAIAPLRDGSPATLGSRLLGARATGGCCAAPTWSSRPRTAWPNSPPATEPGWWSWYPTHRHRHRPTCRVTRRASGPRVTGAASSPSDRWCRAGGPPR